MPLYDYKWDRCTTKKPKVLKTFDGTTFNSNLFEDNVMMELIENEVANVYTTEEVAAVLMSATKSNYSWDLVIKVYGDVIFIDKRDEDKETNILNMHTVCETSVENQPEQNNTINGIRPLMKEATRINKAWLHYCSHDDITTQYKYEDENPFIETPEQVATRHGYVYKVWKIQDEDEEAGKKERKICIRCAVHTHTGKIKPDGEKQTQNVYALNEHDLERTQWRTKVENGVVSCLTREISDNSFKVSRWLMQALLAEVDLVKFAFVTRKDMNDNKKHVVLTTHQVQTTSWAQQMNVSMEKNWSILKYLANEIEAASNEARQKKEAQSQKEEKKATEDDEEDDDDDDEHEFILLKDFNSMAIRLYRKDEEEEIDEDGQIEEKLAALEDEK